MFTRHMSKWSETLNGAGNRKLRTYKTFKHEYGPEKYVNTNMSRKHRSALAKFRCGVAPLKIETGRYNNISVDNRICFNCPNCVEDEAHVLLNCPLYTHFTSDLLGLCCDKFPRFTDFTTPQQLALIFTCEDFIYILAKTCCNILEYRRLLLYR